ncbi:protein BEARSKIN1 [Ricinus communis]|uniref:Transcription factor, putative n=1 Tax=Ricinus communis TaxID=3988 RepID=B9RJ46_RICCO|nr:protein BEARSKIN1 [Ricinus communis]EEF48348.1 transcription factor, putative [Ricinus communis]|eukprot:XP_002513765.1 protein BEARSKIN1 [Ricinus communis]
MTALETMQVGVRFRPLDEELLMYYLSHKINNLSLPNPCPVKDCDLYGKNEPWEIWDYFGGQNLMDVEFLYFFTQLKRKSSSSSRILRTVGTGTWHGDTSGKPVLDRKTKKVIGLIKKFHYKKPKSAHNGGWLMREYSLVGQSSDCVLCCLKMNKSGEKRNRLEAETKDYIIYNDDVANDVSKRLKTQHHVADEVRGNQRVEINNIEPQVIESYCTSLRTLIEREPATTDQLNDKNCTTSHGSRVEESFSQECPAMTDDSYWANLRTEAGGVNDSELEISFEYLDWLINNDDGVSEFLDLTNDAGTVGDAKISAGIKETREEGQFVMPETTEQIKSQSLLSSTVEERGSNFEECREDTGSRKEE